MYTEASPYKQWRERWTMTFSNSYEDAKRAEAYSKLEFTNTYYLAYRDLPEIISNHVRGTNALDFGCGTGRSTRFLRNLGFTTVGVDISEDMLKKARETDPGGDYHLTSDDDFSQLKHKAYVRQRPHDGKESTNIQRTQEVAEN